MSVDEDRAVEATFLGHLSQHLSSRALRETAEEQENRYKRLVLDDLTAVGVETPEGHFVYEFDEERIGGFITGLGGRRVTSVKREKRAPTVLDPDAVEQHLPDQHRDEVFQKNIAIEGLSAEMCVAVLDALDELGVPSDVSDVIDEDNLLALNYSGEVSDDLLQQMYVEGKVIYALKVNYSRS